MKSPAFLSRLSARTISAQAQTIAEAGLRCARPRSYSLQNRQPQIVSAACKRGDHAACYSLNCVCDRCGHRRGA
jgi:hypothetical protein